MSWNPPLKADSSQLISSDFSVFHMEDALEEGRWTARWNAGESGGPALELGQLLDIHLKSTGVQKSRAALLEELGSLRLCDSPNFGSQRLRESVARLHPGALPENVLITTGTSEALLLFFLHYRPRTVALIQPGFQLLSELARVTGARLIPLPLRWDEQAHVKAPIDEWISLILKEEPELVLINHPHNPSGMTLSITSLMGLQDACERVGAALLGDEHYRFLVDEEDPSSLRSLPLGPTLYQSENPRSFVTGSFIKCLGTPGLRIGWILGPAQILRKLQNIKNYTTHTVNPISEQLALWVLESPGLEDFRHARDIWLENKASLAQFLMRHPSWLAEPPKGGWVTCLSHESFPRSFSDFSREMKKNGCFLLDLNLMELKSSGANDCGLMQRGGFRLGLGMEPPLFRDMLTFLSSLA